MLKQEFKNELMEKYEELFGDNPVVIRVTTMADGYKPMSKIFKLSYWQDYYKLLNKLEVIAVKVGFTSSLEVKEYDNSTYTKGIAVDIESAGFTITERDNTVITIEPKTSKRIGNINSIEDILYFINTMIAGNPFFKLFEPKANKESGVILYRKMNTNCRIEIGAIIAKEDGLYSSVPLENIIKYGISVIHKPIKGYPKMAVFYINNENIYTDIINIENGLHKKDKCWQASDWYKTDWNRIKK